MRVSDEPMPYVIAGELYRLIRDGHFRKICPSFHEFVNKFLLGSHGAAGVNILKIIRSQVCQHRAIGLDHCQSESLKPLSKLSFIRALCISRGTKQSDQDEFAE
jgi:hypothetical protein